MHALQCLAVLELHHWCEREDRRFQSIQYPGLGYPCHRGIVASCIGLVNCFADMVRRDTNSNTLARRWILHSKTMPWSGRGWTNDGALQRAWRKWWRQGRLPLMVRMQWQQRSRSTTWCPASSSSSKLIILGWVALTLPSNAEAPALGSIIGTPTWTKHWLWKCNVSYLNKWHAPGMRMFSDGKKNTLM